MQIFPLDQFRGPVPHQHLEEKAAEGQQLTAFTEAIGDPGVWGQSACCQPGYVSARGEHLHAGAASGPSPCPCRHFSSLSTCPRPYHRISGKTQTTSSQVSLLTVSHCNPVSEYLKGALPETPTCFSVFPLIAILHGLPDVGGDVLRSSALF